MIICAGVPTAPEGLWYWGSWMWGGVACVVLTAQWGVSTFSSPDPLLPTGPIVGLVLVLWPNTRPVEEAARLPCLGLHTGLLVTGARVAWLVLWPGI